MKGNSNGSRPTSSEVELLDVEGLLTRQPGAVIKRRDWLELESSLGAVEVQGWLDQHGYTSRADALGFSHRLLPILDDMDYRLLAQQLKKSFQDQDRQLAKWLFQLMSEWNLTSGNVYDIPAFNESNFDDACILLVRFLAQYVADTSELIAAIFEALQITYIRDWGTMSQRMNSKFKFSYMNNLLQSLGPIPFNSKLYELIKERAKMGVMTGPDGKVGIILPLFLPYGVNDYAQMGRHELRELASDDDPVMSAKMRPLRPMTIFNEYFHALSNDASDASADVLSRYKGYGTYFPNHVMTWALTRAGSSEDKVSGKIMLDMGAWSQEYAPTGFSTAKFSHLMNQLWNDRKYQRDVDSGSRADIASSGDLRSGIFAGMISTNLHHKMNTWRERYSNFVVSMRDPGSRIFQFFSGSVLNFIDLSYTFTKISGDVKGLAPIDATQEAVEYRKFMATAMVPSSRWAAAIRRTPAGIPDPMFGNFLTPQVWNRDQVSFAHNPSDQLDISRIGWLATLTERADFLREYLTRYLQVTGTNAPGHVEDFDYPRDHSLSGSFLLRYLAAANVTKPILFTNDPDERLRFQQWADTLRGSLSNLAIGAAVKTHPVTLDPTKWYIIGLDSLEGQIPTVADIWTAGNAGKSGFTDQGWPEMGIETGVFRWVPPPAIADAGPTPTENAFSIVGGQLQYWIQILRSISESLVSFVKDSGDALLPYTRMGGDRGIMYYLYEELAQGMIIPREIGLPRVDSNDIFQCGYYRIVADDDVITSTPDNQRDDWAWFFAKGAKVGPADGYLVDTILNAYPYIKVRDYFRDDWAARLALHSGDGDSWTKVYDRAFYREAAYFVGDAFTRPVLDLFTRKDTFPLVRIFTRKEVDKPSAHQPGMLSRLLYGVDYPVKPYTDGVAVGNRNLYYEDRFFGEKWSDSLNLKEWYPYGAPVVDVDNVVDEIDGGDTTAGHMVAIRASEYERPFLTPHLQYAILLPRLKWDLLRPLVMKVKNALGHFLTQAQPVYAASKFLDISPMSWQAAASLGAAEIPISAMRILKVSEYRSGSTAGAPVAQERPTYGKPNSGSGGRNARRDRRRTGTAGPRNSGSGGGSGRSSGNRAGGPRQPETLGEAKEVNVSSPSGTNAKVEKPGSNPRTFRSDAAPTAASGLPPSKVDKSDDKDFRKGKVTKPSAAEAGAAD